MREKPVRRIDVVWTVLSLYELYEVPEPKIDFLPTEQERKDIDNWWKDREKWLKKNFKDIPEDLSYLVDNTSIHECAKMFKTLDTGLKRLGWESARINIEVGYDDGVRFKLRLTRPETDEEYKERKKTVLKKRKAGREAAKKRAVAKEAKERALLEELKSKYEDD